MINVDPFRSRFDRSSRQTNIRPDRSSAGAMCSSDRSRLSRQTTHHVDPFRTFGCPLGVAPSLQPACLWRGGCHGELPEILKRRLPPWQCHQHGGQTPNVVRRGFGGGRGSQCPRPSVRGSGLPILVPKDVEENGRGFLSRPKTNQDNSELSGPPSKGARRVVRHQLPGQRVRKGTRTSDGETPTGPANPAPRRTTAGEPSFPISLVWPAEGKRSRRWLMLASMKDV